MTIFTGRTAAVLLAVLDHAWNALPGRECGASPGADIRMRGGGRLDGEWVGPPAGRPRAAVYDRASTGILEWIEPESAGLTAPSAILGSTTGGIDQHSEQLRAVKVHGHPAGLLMMLHLPETQLHPVEQLQFVERLARARSAIGGGGLQIVITTLSPLILASAEAAFDPDWDSLIRIDPGADAAANPTVVRMDDFRRGTVDRWLTSDAFGLAHARNAAAAEAIEAAKELQIEAASTRGYSPAEDADALGRPLAAGVRAVVPRLPPFGSGLDERHRVDRAHRDFRRERVVARAANVR